MGGVTAMELGGSSPMGTFQGTAGLAFSPREVTMPRVSCESENVSFLVSHRHPNGSQRRQTAPSPTSFYFSVWFWVGFFFSIFKRLDYSGEGPAQPGTSAPVPPATVHSKSCLSLQLGTTGREVHLLPGWQKAPVPQEHRQDS